MPCEALRGSVSGVVCKTTTYTTNPLKSRQKGTVGLREAFKRYKTPFIL